MLMNDSFNINDDDMLNYIFLQSKLLNVQPNDFIKMCVENFRSKSRLGRKKKLNKSEVLELRKCYTQQEVATMLNVSISTISRLENNR